MAHREFIVWLSQTSKDFSAAEASEQLALAKNRLNGNGIVLDDIEPVSDHVVKHAEKFYRLCSGGMFGLCAVARDWPIESIDRAIDVS
jgi:hypothetical protein